MFSPLYLLYIWGVWVRWQRQNIYVHLAIECNYFVCCVRLYMCSPLEGLNKAEGSWSLAIRVDIRL